jgi:hypothetical protein
MEAQTDATNPQVEKLERMLAGKVSAMLMQRLSNALAELVGCDNPKIRKNGFEHLARMVELFVGASEGAAARQYVLELARAA